MDRTSSVRFSALAGPTSLRKPPASRRTETAECDSDVRGHHVDWEPVARAAVGFVRAAAGPPHEPRLANLIGELSLADPEFRTWWPERHVNYATLGTRTYIHPLTGTYSLDWQVLRLPDDDQTLTVMTAPDARSLEALHRLGSPDAT